MKEGLETEELEMLLDEIPHVRASALLQEHQQRRCEGGRFSSGCGAQGVGGSKLMPISMLGAYGPPAVGSGTDGSYPYPFHSFVPPLFSDGSLSSSSSPGTSGMRSPIGEDGWALRSPELGTPEARRRAAAEERLKDEWGLVDGVRAMHIWDDTNDRVARPWRSLDTLGKDNPLPMGSYGMWGSGDGSAGEQDLTDGFLSDSYSSSCEDFRSMAEPPRSQQHCRRNAGSTDYLLSPCHSDSAFSYSRGHSLSPTGSLGDDVFGSSPLPADPIPGNKIPPPNLDRIIEMEVSRQMWRNGFDSNGNLSGLNSVGSPSKKLNGDLSSSYAMLDQSAGYLPSYYYNPSTTPVRDSRATKAFSCEDTFVIQRKGLHYVASSRRNARREHKRSNVFGSHSPTKVCSSLFVPLNYDSLMDVRHPIYVIAKDQQGCRFLQHKFDNGRPEDVAVIFEELIYHVGELMVNAFANYLMQKLFDVCTEEQRLKVIAVLTRQHGELIEISLNPYGTRAVQKLIDTLKTPQQIKMVVSALEPGFLRLIKDPNGNHVIQRCLQCLGNDHNKFIFDAAAKHSVSIATHQHGCCVLQRCIERSSGVYKDNMVMKISDNGLLLSQDPFGNYVVQFIMEMHNQQANAKLMSQFMGNFIELSKNKFGSNVVEKCLKLWVDCRKVIIAELLSTQNFPELMQHQFANYVIQAALSHTKGPLYHELQRAIQPYADALGTHPCCKRIFSRLAFKK